VPGLGGAPGAAGEAVERIHMGYGGGVETLVGAASIAVPGTLAALDEAVRRFGAVEWRTVVQPSIRAARNGFPLSSACHHYLQYSGDIVFGRSVDGHTALHATDGSLLAAGSRVVVPHLADSLELIASEGRRALYEGDLAQALSDYVQERGGSLSMTDLAVYQPVVRAAIEVEIGGWRVATNPPPAVGGAVLAAMLLAFRDCHYRSWTGEALRHLIDVQQAGFGHRIGVLDVSDDIEADTRAMLEMACTENWAGRYASGSTVHTSAVDETGLACSVTASSGYGSGEMPPGTGLWLNNCVGELELNADGTDFGPPGRRLPSNMAPSAARNADSVLAIGSPGADRITTALHQFLVNYIFMGMPLAQAIEHPRIHLDVRGSVPVLACEPGVNLPPIPYDIRPFEDKSMYFGGVGAAKLGSAGQFEVVADPRREGGTFAG